MASFHVSALICQPFSGGRGEEGMCPERHFSRGGISTKMKNFRPAYGHLNAIKLLISVHQRCSVTFKTHQIRLRPGLCSICTLGNSPNSRLGVGPRARRGGRMYACPERHWPSCPHCNLFLYMLFFNKITLNDLWTPPIVTRTYILSHRQGISQIKKPAGHGYANAQATLRVGL